MLSLERELSGLKEMPSRALPSAMDMQEIFWRRVEWDVFIGVFLSFRDLEDFGPPAGTFPKTGRGLNVSISMSPKFANASDG